MVIVDNVYLTFDNIEHFIENNKVYNEDIVEITTTIQDFIDSQGSILKNCDFYSCFIVKPPFFYGLFIELLDITCYNSFSKSKTGRGMAYKDRKIIDMFEKAHW